MDPMEIHVLWFVGLCFLLFAGDGVEVEASHQPQRSLQSLPKEQPYRNAYHFQPLKNWMNGLSVFTTFFVFFYYLLVLFANLTLKSLLVFSIITVFFVPVI